MDCGAESGGSERKGAEASSAWSWMAGRDTTSQASDAGGGAQSSGRSEMQSVWTLAACVLGCSVLLRPWGGFRRSRLDFRVT